MQKRILVIEDDNAFGNMLKDLLETNNYSVTWAKDGQEALLKYSENQFDLLILDVNMPKLNGFEVCENIRKHPFGFVTPIIILSVKDSLPEKLEGLCLGADEYLTKPFYNQGVLDRIPIILEYKKNKLLNNPLTDIPSFTALEARFNELTGTDNHFVYSNITDYFHNITNFTEETMNLIKILADILKRLIAKNNIFHLDGPNFCFFVNNRNIKKIFKQVLTEYKKEYHKIYSEKKLRAYLHLIAFDMADKKGKNILDLTDPIEELDSKLIRNGHFALHEKVKIIAKA